MDDHVLIMTYEWDVMKSLAKVFEILEKEFPTISSMH